MGIRFETITAVILSVAFAPISSEAALAVQNRYTPREFRSVLSRLGYNVPVVDTPLTDERTRQAIREFQRQQNLSVDGVAGSQTQDVAAGIVRDLQHNLNIVMNLKPLLPTSQFYGTQTEAVVRQFQKKFGLPITGIASEDVRNKLEQASKGGPRNHAWVYAPKEFRAVLNGLGYNVTPNSQTLTDERTRQAIREFQRQYNLLVDGTAGSQTQDVAGDIVRNLQQNLNLVIRPEPRLPLNYFYGEQTKTAVRQFQKLFGLPVTGVASLEVRNKLDQAAKRIAN